MASAALRSTELEDLRPHSGGRPIDLVYLARQTLGDPGLEAEILMLFSRMAAVYLERISDSMDENEIAHALHSLKGAAAGIGAAGIAMEAQAAEGEFRETGKLTDERLSDLSIKVEEVQVFITGLLSA
jgi:HPt (histidine-containing phosphotransfer) domain-containing protein